MTAPPSSGPTRELWTLTFALTLAMTSLGILAPVIPRRLDELGAGVTALSVMAGSAAAAQLLAAPVLGRVGDRVGRRPVLLLGLTGYVIAALTFAVIDMVGLFVAVNGLEGALAAGLFPAATVVVADLTPAATDAERTRWIGIVTASYAVGFLIGPLAGGIIADSIDTRAAALTAAVTAVLAVTVTATLGETRPPQTAARDTGSENRRPAWQTVGPVGRLLVVDFLILGAFGFAAPQLVFFAYDEAGLSTTQFGIVVAASALAMAIGQTTLSAPAERLGRRRVVVTGLSVYAVTFAAYIPFHSPVEITLIATVAGLAYGLVGPALTASYLDRVDPDQQASVLGIRTAIMAAGGIVGPLALAVAHSWAGPTTVFTATASGLGVAAVTAGFAFRATTSQRSALAG